MSKLAFEAKRKLVHLLGISYIILYLVFLRLFSHTIALLVLLAIFILMIGLEFFRLIEKKKIPILHVLWREKEENSLGGQVYYLLGIILAFAIFDFRIAITVIFMTIFGDMAAAIFGIAFGKHWIKKLPDTAWEGIIAEFLVDILIGYLILGNVWIIVIPMAFIATFVETLFPHLDDNLAIPLFAGFIGQSLSLIYPF